MPIGAIWRTFLETPLVNVMVGLTDIAFGDYGLALLLFTFLTRALLFPLTVRMLNSMKKCFLQREVVKKKYLHWKKRQLLGTGLIPDLICTSEKGKCEYRKQR